MIAQIIALVLILIGFGVYSTSVKKKSRQRVSGAVIAIIGLGLLAASYLFILP